MTASRRVIACVIRDGDRYLVCQRPAHKRHGGLWEFPGGKTEPGESDEAAARRELREELDVELVRAEPAIAEIGDAGSPFVIVFLPVEIRGEPQCLEHSRMTWGTPAELLALPL
ncbi:MAG TPA: NUDIX domain-containing protein, partial [Gemmatimonadaceae bacterium]|nr:NUDIX domain-containing protein [Gemmatimonadaceae bacterium]